MFLDHTPVHPKFLIKGYVCLEVSRRFLQFGQFAIVPHRRSDTSYVAADDSSHVAAFLPDDASPVSSFTL